MAIFNDHMATHHFWMADSLCPTSDPSRRYMSRNVLKNCRFDHDENGNGCALGNDQMAPPPFIWHASPENICFFLRELHIIGTS